MKKKVGSTSVALRVFCFNIVFCWSVVFPVFAAVHYVDLNSSTPSTPFTNWSIAATNIQDAIDAANTGDQIIVTNGIYTVGGKIKGGDLTNRVALDKAVTVLSVNGPTNTVIQGVWDSALTNGPAAVRAVWLTNGAVLSGFTIREGATRGPTTSPTMDMYGGGVWGNSTSAIVTNCIITLNAAGIEGGGAYRVSLNNCFVFHNYAVGSGRAGSGVALAGSGGAASSCILNGCIISDNIAEQSYGGGTYNCVLKNCALYGNSSYLYGGASSGGSLLNCTIVGNTSSGYSSGYGGAVYNAALTNCVVWGNFHRTSNINTNYINCTFVYSDSDPLPNGAGNISSDPQVLADRYHVAEGSICRGSGTNNLTGTDIDGQSWTNPPSMGCDEWAPVPVIGTPLILQVNASTRMLFLGVTVAGKEPFTYRWFKDGTLLEPDPHFLSLNSPNFNVDKFGPEDAGNYYVVVSNAFGTAQSLVKPVVIRCVDASGVNPVLPFSGWLNAATNIQDAIDEALPGEIVLVTNGVYKSGGKALYGNLTNRVALDKAITVLSVNGYSATIIEGAWDPATTNGPLAVRCAWLVEGASLGGFTLRNGATRGGNFLSYEQQCGGGVGALTNTAIVSNCILSNNSALWLGGGASYVTLNNCLIVGNLSQQGGGTFYANLKNCTVINNYCWQSVVAGAGIQSSTARNSIVTQNFYIKNGFPTTLANYYPPGVPNAFNYCCTEPLPPGAGNTNVIVQFIDSIGHLPANSPCRAAGSYLYATNADLDGELWANPPSMGWDEVIDANLSGPLSVNLVQPSPQIKLPNRNIVSWGLISGRASRCDWSFGDGALTTNASWYAWHAWTNPGDYTITFTAYNNDYPNGVTTNILLHIDPLAVPSLQFPTVSSNAFRFSFSGQTGAKYTIQYSTNLVSPVVWNTLQTISYSSGGETLISDGAWTNETRFYRMLVQ